MNTKKSAGTKLQAGLLLLVLAGNTGAALLSDDFSGAAGTSPVGAALDVGGGYWSITQTDGSGSMNGNYLFATGGGLVASNNAPASLYTTFAASSHSSTLTNGFALSATFIANGYSDFDFTLGLAQAVDKGYFVNLNTGDVIRFTYYVGGATAGTFKWGIYDGGVLLNNDTSSRAGAQPIHSNDVIQLSITCFPRSGLIVGAATNLTQGCLLSSSGISVKTPGLTNTLCVGMGWLNITTNAPVPAKITAFSVTAEDRSASRPLSLASNLPPVMTGFAFQDFTSVTDTNFPYVLNEHAPIDILHAVRPTVYDTVRATYPGKIMIRQLAWGGTAGMDLESIYPGHCLLKTGTKLTADCAATANDTVLYLQDYTRVAASQSGLDKITNSIESYVLLYALDGSGRPDWSRAEHVRLLSVDTALGTVTVKRGQLGTIPLAFTNNQAVVARHMMFWTDATGGQWQLNFSLQCPRGGPFNLTAAEWFAMQVANQIWSGNADGVECDVGRWQWGFPASNPMDCDNDLVADYGYIDGVNSFGLGGQVFLRRLRELFGPNRIIQRDGNDALFGQRGWLYANGVQMESFPTMGYDRYSEVYLHLRSWVSNVTTLPVFSYPFTKTPTTLYGHVYDTDGSNLDWRFRVGFAAALLTGMPHPFASVTDINFDPANPDYNDPNMQEDKGFFKWDEYVGGTNDLNNWKWLGAPQGPAVQITNNLGASNLLASTAWVWTTETNFSSSCSISNGIYSATITYLPSNTIPWSSSYYPGTQIPQTLWMGTRLAATSGMPAFEPGKEYTLEFDARGNDLWNYAGEVFDKVPRALTIHGIANYGNNKPASVALASDWRSYRLSIIADSLAPQPIVFGVSEQLGDVSLRNIRLYEGGAERWVREFTNGIVLLNMTREPWAYPLTTAYRHFHGTQHPEINNGQRVPPTVIVPSWDALFLVTTTGTNIIVPVGVTLDFSPGLLLGSNDNLSGWGIVTGSVTAVSGAGILPGTLAAPTGTLSFSNTLTLNGQTLTFDLSGSPANGNDRIVVAGSLTNNGLTTVSLNYLSGWLGAGTYTLMAYASRAGGTFALDAIYTNATLNVGPTSLTLTVGPGGSQGAPFVWRGDGAANLWDIAASANWLLNSQPAVFNNGAGVCFDDTAAGFTVNLNTIVSPGSFLVNATNDYTITGTGGITGPAGLFKTNIGQLTLSTSNSYSGGTLVAAGTLSGDPASLQGDITNHASLVFNHTNNGTFGGVISGTGALTKLNSGILTLSGLNTYTGDTILGNTAQIQISSDDNLGAGPNITINQNGNLKTTANITTAKNITFVGGNPALNVGAGTTLTVNGTLGGPSVSPRKDNSSGTLTLNGSNAFAASCVFLLQTGRLNLNHPAALNGATLKFNGNVTLDNTGAFTLPTGLTGVQMTSGFTYAGTGSLDLSGVTAGFVQTANSIRTITVMSNTLILGGILTSGTDAVGTTRVPGGLTKAGAGTLILSGPSDYTGNTTNSAGGLLVNDTLGPGAVVVKANATLGGNGVLRGPLTVEPGGVLQPGAGGTNLATLTVSNAVNLSGTTLLMLNRANVQNAGKLAASGLLTLGGALVVTNVGPALQGGDTFTLFTAASLTNAFSSTNLPALASGWSWDTAQLTTSGVIAVVAPAATNQPVFFAPVISGGDLVLSGTNGTAGNQYLVLSTTNLTLPRTSWTVVATNTFGAAGQFAFTNTINPAEPARFCVIQEH